MATWKESPNWTPFDEINGGQQFSNMLSPEDLNALAENIAYLYENQGENEYLGDYAGGNYRAGAIVKYSDGNIYLCIKDTDNEQEPTNAEYWQMLNEEGETAEEWNGTGVVITPIEPEEPEQPMTFTINGTSYQMENRMTWYAWTRSEYNTDGFSCASENDYVYEAESSNKVTDVEGNDVLGTTFIVEGAEYLIKEAVTEDELAGAWKLNSSIENSSIEASFNVSGRFNARKTASMSPMISTSLGFIGLSTESFMLTLGIKDATTAPLNQYNIYSYQGLAADGKSYSGTGVARSSVCSTFEIYSTLEEVTNGQILLAWLKANATKLSAASLITFIIAGASYQAEEGMTWGEWVESEYNTYTYTLSGSKVVNGSGYWVQLNGQSCFGTDFIIDGATYVCVAASGSN